MGESHNEKVSGMPIAIGNNILLQVHGMQEETKGGIFLPEGQRQATGEGVVVSCGVQVTFIGEGDRIPLPIHFQMPTVEFEGKFYTWMDADTVPFVIEAEEDLTEQ